MRKTSEQRKVDLIDSLVAARRCILEAAQALSPDRLDMVFLGTWSVKDLLAHLVGWDYTNLQAVKEILAGQVPGFFQYYDQDWESYNRSLVAQYRIEPFSALLAEAAGSHQQLVAFLEALPAKDLVDGRVKREKGRTVTIRNLLRAEASDEREHAGQVSAFQKEKL